MANPLNDKDFLRALDQQTRRTIYARVIALDWDENPTAEITAMVTGGSINIDGSSIVRRTCSLNMITTSVDVNRIDWAIRTKFRLFIGLQNDINPNYEKIIWFPEGIFIISGYSATYNNSGYTISLQGKDKMSLLNGDMGGNLFAKHDFGVTWIFNNDGSYTKKQIPIKEIIREAVHQYAQESYDNIYINDLDTCGVELVEYRGDGVCWTYNIYDRLDGVPSANMLPPGANAALAAEFQAKFDEVNGAVPIRYRPTGATYDYEITKRVTYGETMGYRATDLTYAGELIENANGTITSMLDKIVKQLGEFEYFYDTQGHFVFQRKKIYFNSSWSSAVMNDNQLYYESKALSSQFSYEFTSNFLVESFANKPQVNAIKNDYSIWGQKTAADGTSWPIHLRYAIDHKPTDYYSLKRRQTFTTEGANGYDWRWLLYLMAEDYMIAQDRIQALHKGLDRQVIKEVDNVNTIVDEPLYECNPELITQDDFDHLYYYDAKSETFIPVAWDSSTKEMDEQLGRNRIQTAVLENTLLFTADLEESYYSRDSLSEIERELSDTNGRVALDWLANNLVDITVSVAGPNETMTWNSSEDWATFSQSVGPIVSPYYLYTEHLSNRKVFDQLNEKYGYTTDLALSNEMLRAIWIVDQGLHSDQINRVLQIARNNYDFSQSTAKQEFYNYFEEVLRPTFRQEWYNRLYAYYIDNFLPHFYIENYQEQKAIRQTQSLIAQWQTALASPYAAYSADILAFLPDLYKIDRDITYEYNDNGTIKTDEVGNPLEEYKFIMERQENGSWKEVKRPNMTQEEWLKWKANQYWNPNIFYWDAVNQSLTIVNPEQLFFWIDFIDDQTDLWQYGPDLIGRRAKVINDDKVKAIYFKDTPELLFVERYSSSPVVEYSDTLAYAHINISPSLATYLYISSQGKSAKEELDNLIYQSTYYQDSITLSTIPIYYLEPNTRIFVQDKKSGISGEYLIKSMSIPLSHDGMMSLNANRASERII